MQSALSVLRSSTMKLTLATLATLAFSGLFADGVRASYRGTTAMILKRHVAAEVSVHVAPTLRGVNLIGDMVIKKYRTSSLDNVQPGCRFE